MSAVPVPIRLSVVDYLELEDIAEEKHEYYNGEIMTMAGGLLTHNRIVRNTLGAIDNHLRGTLYEVFPSDLKVHVKTKAAFVYPDVSVVCGNPQFLEARTDIVTNPAIIIEVLSPKTEAHDRGRKFMLYRQIGTLKRYILISSMEILVECFTKGEDGQWMMRSYQQPEETLELPDIDVKIALSEIYRNATFEAQIVL